MLPQLTFNWIAILAAVLASFFFSFLWYGPLFSKPWAKAMGMKMDKRPDPKVMMRAFALQFLGTFLMVYVLAHTVQVWRPSVWNAGTDSPAASYGFFGAFFTWLGFFVPMQFGKVSWEGRPWKLFLINTAHDFLSLQIICQILAHLR